MIKVQNVSCWNQLNPEMGCNIGKFEEEDVIAVSAKIEKIDGYCIAIMYNWNITNFSLFKNNQPLSN